MKKSVTAHCLVKNEARFIWFSVMSVIRHVDKVLLWDTGSTDGTQGIIHEILKAKEAKGKVDFKEIGQVNPETFTKVRQSMLDETKTDWLIVVDGDEVWWEDSIEKVVEVVESRGSRIESIVVPTYNLVGDIFHYQEESAGGYYLAGRKGHLALRGVNRKIPGLKSDRPHGTWGWTDNTGKMVQDRDPKKIIFVEAPYLHATHLPRAKSRTQEFDVPKRAKKLKYEFGIPFTSDFYYPEVFFRPRPSIVPFPWEKMSSEYKLKAFLQTPLKRIKRSFLPKKVGY